MRAKMTRELILSGVFQVQDIDVMGERRQNPYKVPRIKLRIQVMVV